MPDWTVYVDYDGWVEEIDIQAATRADAISRAEILVGTEYDDGGRIIDVGPMPAVVIAGFFPDPIPTPPF
jgi:hypothetical protein